MKKIIAAVLLAVMALSLFSCAKPEFIKLDSAKIASVEIVSLPNTEIDKDGFVTAYNAAKVTNASTDVDTTGKDVIVVPFSNGNDIVTIFYLEDNKFLVTGTCIEKDYIIEAKELYDFYKSVIDPEPVFVGLGSTYTATLIKDPKKEIDTAALAKYYIDSKLVGKAGDKNSDETVVVVCNDGEYTLTLSYLGENQFRVSGSTVKVDYIIESKGLADLYTEAVK